MRQCHREYFARVGPMPLWFDGMAQWFDQMVELPGRGLKGGRFVSVINTMG